MPDPDQPVCCYRSGDAIRSRSVGTVVPFGQIDIPAPPAGLAADWDRDIAALMQQGMAAGDVECLSLTRTRARWPGYRHGVQAASGWARRALLAHEDPLASCDVALMACRGARYHHDAMHYGAAAFCNLFLSEDQELDLVFPSAGRRIALNRGTVVIFDTGQPHAVLRRGGEIFDPADFADDRHGSLVFLTWELPIESPAVAQALGVTFDVCPSGALPLTEEQMRIGGTPVDLCPASGRWRADAAACRPRCD